MLCPAHPPLLYRPNYELRCTHHETPQYAILSVSWFFLNSQLSSTPIFLPLYEGPSFTPTQSNEQSFSPARFNIYIPTNQRACLKNMDRTVASLPEFDMFLMLPRIKRSFVSFVLRYQALLHFNILLAICQPSFCSLTSTVKPTSQQESKELTVLSSAALCLRIRFGGFRAVFVLRVTPYSLVSGNQHFGDIFFLHVPEYTV